MYPISGNYADNLMAFCVFFFTQIYSYSGMVGTVLDDRFMGRIEWAGSKNTLDLQDGSLHLLNVTFNDTGMYHCYFNRILSFTYYEFHTNASKLITINVVAKGENKTMGTSVLSRIFTFSGNTILVALVGKSGGATQLWSSVGGANCGCQNKATWCYLKIF